MKKTKIGLPLFVVILTVLLSCENPYLDTPNIPRNDNNRSAGEYDAPDGLIATHGEKRSITLSWNPKPDAVRYYIYSAKSPLDDFVRCGEETSNQFKIVVQEGTTLYFRVSAVSRDETESSKSAFEMGTSLAQPFITDITDISESNATVTWYMDNASDDTYLKNLMYIVYCFEGSTLVGQPIPLNGESLSKNEATFNNLYPNKSYKYQVEAYLLGNQNLSEISDPMDAETARLMKPKSPVNLRVARGKAKNKIDVSFELPPWVDLPISSKEFEQKPVRFIIKKRRYSESGINQYNDACTYFGSLDPPAGSSTGVKFGDYIPGQTVTWTDTSISRGVEYEYQVQAYVDDTLKVLTADSSKVSAWGWALSEGSLNFDGNPVYEIDSSSHWGTDFFANAELTLKFEFDPKDNTIPYDYTLVEKIESIGDDFEYDLDKNGPPIRREVGTFNSHNEIKTYKRQMDLTQPTTENTPGRGIYSYEVEIKLDGTLIDTVTTFDDREVIEDKDPIVVDGFHVQDGYSDKYVLKWSYRENRKYELYISNDRTAWTLFDTVNPTPNNNSTVEINNYSYTYDTNVTTNQIKYFAIKPYFVGQTTKFGRQVSAPSASYTLGVPVISVNGDPSYSNITVAWPDEVQKADAYRIKYWYTIDGKQNAATTAIVSKDDQDNLSRDGDDRLTYKFSPLEADGSGYKVDVAKAGLEIRVEVEALNESLREELNSSNEISTTSNEVATRLVGPGSVPGSTLLNPDATKAASPLQIEVSWNGISGASGYYIFRRQFNMENTAVAANDPIIYYVPSVAVNTSNISGIKGKEIKNTPNGLEDTSTLKARARFSDSRYTFTDEYLNDGEYDGAYSGYWDQYRNQQNDMAQGFSYRYFIVPVINASEGLSSGDFTTQNGAVTSYTREEDGKTIRYNGASVLEKDGFAIGFAQNVTASKGTYASTGNLSNGILVSWTLPTRLAGVSNFSPRYTVYRRPSGGAWDPNPVVSNINALSLPVADIPPERGRTYEYVVGISNENGDQTDNGRSDPRPSKRFIEKCKTFLDERGRPNYLGYMLGYVKVNYVTRGEDTDLNAILGERVTWQSGGITNNVSTDPNWGIDGYTIYVMNRNINANWHIAIDNITTFEPQGQQSYVLTPSNTPNINFSDTIGNTTRNLLYVLRDYKHFYKVKSYVLNGDTKIYGPEPAWNYQYRWGTDAASHIAASNEMENDYVKWGARQISKTDFIRIASLYFARGQNRVYTGDWGSSSRSGNSSGNYGASGSLTIEYNYTTEFSGANRNHVFNNYKDDLNARTGDWMTFITLNGTVWAECYTITARPRRYTADRRGNNNGTNPGIDIKGPWDTPHLYSGNIKFGTGNRNTSTNFTWDGGNVQVIYPTGAAAENISFGGVQNTPMEFLNQTRNRWDNSNTWR